MPSFSSNRPMNFDGFVKSPSAALRFTFVVAAYLVSRPHSSDFARLASGAFYAAIALATSYEINLTPRTPLSHKSYVHRIVVLAEKGLLSAVSSLRYRMGVSRYHHSRYSSHIQIPTLMNASCQSKTSMVSPCYRPDYLIPKGGIFFRID